MINFNFASLHDEYLNERRMNILLEQGKIFVHDKMFSFPKS